MNKALTAFATLSALATVDGGGQPMGRPIVRVTSRTAPIERGARFNTTEDRQAQRAARKARRRARKVTGFR